MIGDFECFVFNSRCGECYNIDDDIDQATDTLYYFVFGKETKLVVLDRQFPTLILQVYKILFAM